MNEEIRGDASTKLGMDSDKKLKVLLVSDPLLGHLAPLLALGEELAGRGHNVTQFLPLSEASQALYKTHVENFGVHLWNVSAEELVNYNMEQIMKQVSKEFFSTSVAKISQYGAIFIRIVSEHIGKSLQAGEDWDVIIGRDYLESVLMCLSSVHGIPVVSVSFNLLAAYQLYPPWPWPGLMYGAHSDFMGFSDRLLNIPYFLAMKAFVYASTYPSMTVLARYHAHLFI